MNLKLHKIVLQNIKGIEFFSKDIHNGYIYKGENGIGKTTMLDTISWILTGSKNLQNKMFNPESLTLDQNEKLYGELEFDIDGVDHVLKIEKPRVGASTQYYIDGESVLKKNYEQWLSSYNLKQFPLLANPNYLLKTLQHDEARKQILNIVERPSHDKINQYLKSKNYDTQILEKLNYNLNWNKDTINNHIHNNKINLQSKNEVFEHYRKQLAKVGKNNFDSLINDKNLIKEQIKSLKESFDTENLILMREKVKDDLKKCFIKSDELTKELAKIKDIDDRAMSRLNAHKKDLSEMKKVLFSKTNKNLVYKCTSCNQIVKYNEVKAKEEIVKLHVAIKEKEELIKYSGVELHMDERKKLNDEIKAKRVELNSLFEKEKEYDFKYSELITSTSLKNLESQLEKIELELSKIKDHSFFESNLKRIRKEKEAIYEELEFWKTVSLACDLAIEYENTLIKQILENVFKNINLTLIKSLKNGKSRNIFTVSVKDVPYAQLNYASQIKAGIEICKGVQKLLNIETPILVDNLESVSDYSMFKAQLIGAEVSK